VSTAMLYCRCVLAISASMAREVQARQYVMRAAPGARHTHSPSNAATAWHPLSGTQDTADVWMTQLSSGGARCRHGEVAVARHPSFSFASSPSAAPSARYASRPDSWLGAEWRGDWLGLTCLQYNVEDDPRPVGWQSQPIGRRSRS
jgi:hypothetical protein